MHTHHKHATPARSGSTGATTTTKAAVISGASARNPRTVTENDIRLCAYQKWESAGKPTGDGVQFWLEAEQELMHGT